MKTQFEDQSLLEFFFLFFLMIRNKAYWIWVTTVDPSSISTHTAIGFGLNHLPITMQAACLNHDKNLVWDKTLLTLQRHQKPKYIS